MPGTALYNVASTPMQEQMLAEAKREHNVTTPGVPPEWAFDASGNLVRRSDGLPVGLGHSYADGTPKPHDSFLKQLLHASPYIAAALGGSALAGMGGGGSALATVPTGAGVSGMTATSMGLPVTAGLGTAGTTTAATTGGSILGKMAASKGAEGIADVMGGAARSGSESNYRNDYLKTILENSKLNRDRFAVEAPGKRLQDSTKASLMSTFTPSKVDWGPGGFTPGAGARGVQPTFTGGMRGGMANLDSRTRSLQSRVMDDELESQLQGGATGGGQDRQMNMDIGKSSGLDKVVGAGAFGSSMLAALLKAWGK